MKKTDVAMIILIAAISVLGSFFVTRAIMGSPSKDTQKVKTMEKIEEGLTEPDSAIFNKDAINPAVKVDLGEGSSNNGS